MREIEFTKAGMENFCLYKNLMEYYFPNDKVRLITGPNGVGKTTIFDCIPFTAFGITTKGLKGDDVVNNEVGKNCRTYFEFKSIIGDITDNYRVERYVKDSKFGDTVLLYKNDFTKPYKKGQREVLPVIEEVFIPQKLFMNTILFGQKVKDFFTDLGDADKKEIFRKVLQLDPHNNNAQEMYDYICDDHSF